LDKLGRYSLLADQSGAPAQGTGKLWRKAFNYDLRCYAAVILIPKAAFPSEESRERFTREIGVATGIRHCNMASVFPLELIEESCLYAIEFCDGETLAALTQRSNCLEALDALNIAKQIAAGLEAANSSGLLHRNITADNVIVLQEDDDISVKVCGLGLPSAGTLKGTFTASPEADFRSPEEIAGKEIDVRSEIYSLGALLYFMAAELEAYQEFRVRSLAGETQKLLAEQIPHRVRLVLRHAVGHNPAERVGTFAELIEEIDRARIAPEQPELQEIAVPVQTGEVVEVPTSPAAEIEEKATKPAEPDEGELTIPVELLSVAQPGTLLRLNRIEAESRSAIVVWVGDTFRIGRASEAQLVTRFLPRNKTNDIETKRLSTIHVTVKSEGCELLLFDGSAIKPSTNGSAFNGKALSAQKPIRLIEPGELKLANTYSIRMIPLLEESNGAPAIANLEGWRGPNNDNDRNTSLRGAVLFMANEKSDAGLTVWLFSTAAFGSSTVSPIDFTSSAKIAALRYFRGCFWVEQRSTESLLLNGLALGRGEIAPLATGQTLEVKGSKYAVEIEDPSKRPKS
jgi:serine/threonine protein kinase